VVTICVFLSRINYSLPVHLGPELVMYSMKPQSMEKKNIDIYKCMNLVIVRVFKRSPNFVEPIRPVNSFLYHNFVQDKIVIAGYLFFNLFFWWPLLRTYLFEHIFSLLYITNPCIKAVDCQQLKRMGARSASCSAAWNDFIPTACLCNMRTWGDMARLFGCGRREAATDCVARIWEEFDSVLSMTSTTGSPNPSSSTAAAPGPARARGEHSKPGRKIWPKVNGGLTTGVC
jgi:hypothetical protein